MDTQRIIFNAYATPNESVGGEETYDHGITVESYLKKFEEDVKHRSGKTNVVIEFIRITDHDKKGNFIRDKNGIRQETYLYRYGRII